eukprot:GHVH01008776.1.p1 GENE.GHVH01008776.1~~GHVH01008776.1.p1  ORF type:complete len:345 (+),score=66.88 GHVH01008776.1:57-1091(+)
MSAIRSRVNVYGKDGAAAGACDMPTVFGVKHRPDIVSAVCNRAHLSTRNPYGVKKEAGYEVAASSWGTGRAVARVPRVPGGGTHRSGQAAFANFCRGGGMFAPTTTYRRWARQTNLTERRHAQAFAVSAAGCTSLVIARGHKVEKVPEFPLVVSDDIETVTKTADLVKYLKAVGGGDDLKRAADNKKIRAGKGKNRNRKYKNARGPLIVYAQGDLLAKTSKNIPGVDCMKVTEMSIKQLAPGGKGGRFIVYSKSAFEMLNSLFGNEDGVSQVKKGYKLPRCVVSGSVNKVLSSEQLQSVIRPKMVNPKKEAPHCYNNLLKNKAAMAAVTPKMDEIKSIVAKRMK